MTEKPIIFSSAMVTAILSGRKSQTRRILKPQPFSDGYFEGLVLLDRVWKDGDARFSATSVGGGAICECIIPLRYAVGDRLWVRETWAEACELDDNDKPASEMRTYYRADGEPFSRWLDPDTDEWRDGIKWSSPIHMPRWASRITLEVTAVKVERLQNISAADCRAEGHPVEWDRSPNPEVHDDAARDWFQDLWTTLHGPDSWTANPWCCCISFERVK